MNSQDLSTLFTYGVPVLVALAYLAGYGHGWRVGSNGGSAWADEALEWRAVIKDAARRHIEYDCVESELEVVDAQDKPA